MQQWIKHLREAGIRRIFENEPLAPYTTWKIGGPADVLVIPEDLPQLQAALHVFHRHGVPWILLGKGSNTLVADKGVRGAVIKLGSGFEQVRFEQERVVAGAAYSFIKLSVLAGKHGLTGLEFAGGIPGSVGGAVYMNAGAHGSDVSRILVSADVVREDGELVRLQKEDLRFGYRHSVLQERKAIVVEAVFQLKAGDRKEIAAAMAIYKDRRLKTQPLQMACAGSVFRNPENDHAARLIEQAGLKGLRVGGAEVSGQHANFIVNTGNATAGDVLALIEQIQRTVQDRFGIRLEPEVLLVGER
jgi:UDP-N-acetylmuramate dehydrogenase